MVVSFRRRPAPVGKRLSTSCIRYDGSGTGEDEAVSRSALVLQAEDLLLAVTDVVRRVVGARVTDPHLADDIVQETLARLIDNRSRLEESALLPYAVVTARNLVASQARADERSRRHAHRLLDRREPDQPEARVIALDERRSLREALDQLTEKDRSALLAHEVDGVGTRAMAEAAKTTPGAVAVRLAAARAKLRVEYLISYRNIELPSPRCRSVLVALSAGDRRRQRALAAGEHLLDCETCASVSEPLLRRERALAGIWPLPLLPSAAKLVLRSAKDHPVQTTASVAVAVGLGVGGALLLAGDDRPPSAPPASASASTAAAPTTAPPRSAIEVAGQPVLPLDAHETLATFVDQTVQVREATVLSVAADEGFWIGETSEQRLWVQLMSPSESPFAVQAGQRVSFDGVIVAHPPGFAAVVGVDPAEGAVLLDRQAHHIRVAASRLALDG